MELRISSMSISGICVTRSTPAMSRNCCGPCAASATPFGKERKHELQFPPLTNAGVYAGVLAICLVIFGAAVYLGLARYLDSTLRNSLRSEGQSIGEKLLIDVNKKGESFVI